MRYLVISLVFLLFSCGSYPKKNDYKKVERPAVEIINPYFSDMEKDYIYKAKINFRQKSFGGIFIVKKLEKDHHRVVFTTEMGNKILDFSFIGNHVEVNYIVEEINKKIVMDLLKQDFFVVIHETPRMLQQFSKPGDTTLLKTEFNKNTYFYIYHDNRLNKVIRTKNAKEKSVYIFSQVEDNSANEIDITHKKIKLNIHLKSI
ncbi:hypothetical protein KCTC52924_00211 [Arenibacter antarcticus]|uniref:Lipoprotein n=1 Tax=Arenibacter antarcticus TaxID=2040469 RepID=A0ABW5VKD7_9FLAO|nr:hypothetical protein [Arenibacter sp. H213]MCM4169024.1 hypothetical protein [Arenibacter sp. H213]